MSSSSLVHRVAQRYLQSATLGKWLPQPLKQWLEDMYRHIQIIDDFNDFYLWLQDFSKVREIQRRSGVPYDIGLHWSTALDNTPMLNFDAANDEARDWREIFYAIDKNPQEYKEFWRWAANPYQVRLWVANVYRMFWNGIWGEHLEKLSEQLEPDTPENPDKKVQPEKTPEPSEPDKPETWEQEEQRARQRK